MLLKEMRQYQNQVADLKNYFQKRIEKNRKFNPEMVFSAEQAAWIVLNTQFKRMLDNQEPSEEDIEIVETCFILKQVLENEIDAECYVEPQFELWNLILNGLNGDSYLVFFQNVLIPAFAYSLSIDRLAIEEWIDDSTALSDKDWATECICNAYESLNSQKLDKEVQGMLREVCWNEDYCRALFNYLK